ncbi:MAG TPA: TlpA disulfide reductase family protein [Candidatus Tyrphobacter sp.]
MKDRSLTTLAVVVSALLILAIVVVAVVRAFHPSPQLQNASFSPTIGTAQFGGTAPEFRIPTTAGLFDLDQQRRPVLLEVFASWCPHCQRETTVMNRLYQDFKSRVAFIAVPGSATAMDGASPESEADLFNFMQRFRVAYPVAVFDPQLTVANEYIQGGFPTIAIIGSDKKVVYLNSGEIPYATLAEALKKAR